VSGETQAVGGSELIDAEAAREQQRQLRLPGLHDEYAVAPGFGVIHKCIEQRIGVLAIGVNAAEDDEVPALRAIGDEAWTICEHEALIARRQGEESGRVIDTRR
jgi:hypothetical protein